jgi:hypothetical protein
MAIIDDVKNKLVQAGQAVSNTMKGYADASRLNSAIDAQEAQIKALMAGIGQDFCEGMLEQGDSPSIDAIAPVHQAQMLAAFSQVTEARQVLDSLKLEADRLKNVRICPNCGAQCDSGVSVCPACKQKLPETARQTEGASAVWRDALGKVATPPSALRQAISKAKSLAGALPIDIFSALAILPFILVFFKWLSAFTGNYSDISSVYTGIDSGSLMLASWALFLVMAAVCANGLLSILNIHPFNKGAGTFSKTGRIPSGGAVFGLLIAAVLAAGQAVTKNGPTVGMLLGNDMDMLVLGVVCRHFAGVAAYTIVMLAIVLALAKWKATRERFD